MKHRHGYRALALLTIFILAISSSVISANGKEILTRCNLADLKVDGGQYDFCRKDEMVSGGRYEVTMDFANNPAQELPSDSKEWPIYYTLEGYDYVEIMEITSDKLDPVDPWENRTVYFSWKPGVTDKTSVSITFVYTLAEQTASGVTNLDGTYAIARFKNGTSGTANTVTATVIEKNTMLQAKQITVDKNGFFDPDGVVWWTFEHQGEGRYLIHAENQYLTIDSSGSKAVLRLVSLENAKSLLISRIGDSKYLITDGKGNYLNDKSNGVPKKFQAYKPENVENDAPNFISLLSPQKAAVERTITFDNNGQADAVMPADITDKAGTTVFLPIPDPIQSKDFYGWSPTGKTEDLITNPGEYMIEGDVRLYALWIDYASVHVTVVWYDNNNEDGKRPKDGVQVRLLADGVQVGEEVTLTGADADEQGNWVHTFSQLHTFNSNGSGILYEVEEKVPAGYRTEISGFTITNKPGPTVTLTKTLKGKIWLISCDIMDPEFKEEIIVHGNEKWRRDVLSNPTGVLSKEGHRHNKCGDSAHWVVWVNDKGAPYRLDEIKSGATGDTLPTRLAKTETQMTRDEIEAMLADRKAGTPVDSGLVAKFGQNFASYSDDWSQVKPGTRIFWITWDGGQVWHHTGVPYEAELNYVLHIEGREEPIYIAAGETVTLNDLAPGIYEITEDPSPYCILGEISATGGATVQKQQGWTATIEIPDTDGEVNIQWENEYKPEDPPVRPDPPQPETTSVTIKKVWDDNDDQDGLRKPLEVDLLVTTDDVTSVRQGQQITYSKVKTVTLTGPSDAKEWTHTERGLYTVINGKKATYSWSEVRIPDGYEQTGIETVGSVTTITNKHTPETIDLSVTKVWDDDGNRDGIRPEELKVTLSNGAQVTLNEANGWTATVEDLPKYAGGKEIVYTWTEEGLPAGYELTDTSVDGTVTTLTNSHAPEETRATVKKVWDDSNNQDSKRPDELKVTLSNGTEVTLNEANGWTATVEHLLKYAGGEEVEYTWTEDESGLPEGYALTGTSVDGTVTTLTNAYTPELISLTVRKKWNDQNNALGLRPESIRMTLNSGMTVVLNEANHWSAEITDLPAYSDGRPIEYTWTEQTVLGYTQESAVTTSHETVFTNRPYDREQDQPTQPAQGGARPRMAGNPTDTIEDYGTPLGIAVEYNHAGDCFD